MFHRGPWLLPKELPLQFLSSRLLLTGRWKVAGLEAAAGNHSLTARGPSSLPILQLHRTPMPWVGSISTEKFCGAGGTWARKCLKHLSTRCHPWCHQCHMQGSHSLQGCWHTVGNGFVENSQSLAEGSHGMYLYANIEIGMAQGELALLFSRAAQCSHVVAVTPIHCHGVETPLKETPVSHSDQIP